MVVSNNAEENCNMAENQTDTDADGTAWILLYDFLKMFILGFVFMACVFMYDIYEVLMNYEDNPHEFDEDFEISDDGIDDDENYVYEYEAEVEDLYHFGNGNHRATRRRIVNLSGRVETI